jgi:hypothetical protein
VTLAYNGFHVVGTNAINATGGVGYTISGSTAGSATTDYSFTAPVIASVAGSIAAKTLTVTAPVIGGTTGKVFDGTNAATGATLTGGSVAGAIAGDTLALNTSAVTLAYNGFHVVGTNAIVATGASTLSITSPTAGSVASDYSFTAPVISNAAASITAKALTATAPVIGGTLTKTYDGTNAATGATLTGGAVIGGIAGDTLALNTSAVTLTYNGVNVAGTNAINAAGALSHAISASAAGSATSDYSFTAPTVASVAASITPASLLYVANPVSVVVGAPQPSFSGTVSGVASIDTLGGITTGTLAFTSTATTNSAVGNYAIDGSGLSVISGNYNSLIAQAPGNASAFTINVASIANAAPVVRQVVGQTVAATTQVISSPVMPPPPPAPPPTEPVVNSGTGGSQSGPNAGLTAAGQEAVGEIAGNDPSGPNTAGGKTVMRKVPVCR